MSGCETEDVCDGEAEDVAVDDCGVVDDADAEVGGVCTGLLVFISACSTINSHQNFFSEKGGMRAGKMAMSVSSWLAWGAAGQ